MASEKKENHDFAEMLVIGGVVILLLTAIIVEAIKGEDVDLGIMISGLMIILTSIANHFFKKKADIAASESRKNDGTSP